MENPQINPPGQLESRSDTKIFRLPTNLQIKEENENLHQIFGIDLLQIQTGQWKLRSIFIAILVVGILMYDSLFRSWNSCLYEKREIFDKN